MNQEPIEAVTFPESPDFLTSKREASRNSTGKDNTRKSPSLLAGDEKPLPHYLRASTGSCHDYCKYGRNHAFEAKARRPKFRRSSGDNEIPEKVRNQVEVPSRGGRKKKPAHSSMSQQETKLSGQSNGSEGFSPSPQNSISSADHRYSDKAEGLSEEHMSVESIGPSVVEKSVITDELIVSTQEDVLLEEHMVSILINQEEVSGEMPISILSDTPSTISSRHSLGNQAVKPSREPLNIVSKVSPSIKARSLKASDSNKREVPKLRPTPKPKNEMPVKAKVPSGKSSITKPKAPSVSKKTVTSDQVKTIKQKSLNTASSGTAKVLKLKASSPLKKTDIPERASTTSKPKSSVTKSLSPSTAVGGPDISRSKPSKISRTQDLSKTVEKKVMKLPRLSLSPKIGETKVLKTPRASLSPKICEKKVLKTPRASLSPKISEKKVLKTPRALLSPNIVDKKVLKASRASLSPNIVDKKVLKASRASLSPNIGDKKVLKAPGVSLSPRPAVTRISSIKLRKFGNKKLGSPVKNAKKVSVQDNDQVKEKTIYAIDPKPEIKSEEDVPQVLPNYKASMSSQTLSATSSQSTASDTSHEDEENEDTESMYSDEVSELASEDEGEESDNEVESQEAEERRMSRKSVGVRPEDEVQAPHKLKFRRGKVLDPQSENNGPRRLRFRKARVVAENQNSRGDSGRRSFRKRSNIADPNEVPEAPNVVLRHQDQQGKKDTQGLFNHVIEETASKLVETRKSKVKALVGAFETVISLQDTKAAPTV